MSKFDRNIQLTSVITRCQSLASISKQAEDGEREIVQIREGIIRGNRKKKQKDIIGKKILAASNFPEETFLHLPTASLPQNDDPETDGAASTDFSAFRAPQLIIRQSWKTEQQRFQAALIASDDPSKGILCTQSYFTVHALPSHQQVLEAACLSYNSVVAVYHLLLTSGRLASYRPEPLGEEFLRVPVPLPRTGLLEGLKTYKDVDARIRKELSFKDAEWVLVDDLIQYTLPDFKGTDASPGRQRTTRGRNNSRADVDLELHAYCDRFIRVIKAGFGKDKNVCATIFRETDDAFPLPVRLVAIHFDWPGREPIKYQPLSTGELWRQLSSISSGHSGVLHQRVARVYDTVTSPHGPVPTAYLIKPDRVRYWLRSVAMRDADDVAVDIMRTQVSPGGQHD